MRSAKNILLVEDEPTLQRILGSVLTDAGHRVESVGTAEQALERLRDASATDVDLVLSDKNLPAMNGLDLLHEVRTDAHGRRSVGFVLVTGYPSRDSALAVLAHDGDGYLVKPFRSLTDAVEEMQRVLDASLLERRSGCPDARRLAQLLSGVPGSPPVRRLAAVLVDDRELATRVHAVLEGCGMRVTDVGRLPRDEPVAVVARRSEDLRAFSDRRPGSSLVLVDGGAAFTDIVRLIGSGGGAIVDPGLLPGSP